MQVLTTAPYPLPPGLLEGRSHRAASVVCTEDVEVMVMDREVFNRVVMDDDKGGGKNKCAISSAIETCRIRSRSCMQVLTTALGPFPTGSQTRCARRRRLGSVLAF